MDRRVFLRDIDDWELYARGLEAHIGAWHEALENALEEPGAIRSILAVGDVYHDVCKVVREAADRADRLWEKRHGPSLREADRLAEDQLDPDDT